MYNLYLLTSTLDNRYYIGITKNTEQRYNNHLKYTSRKNFYNGYWIRKTLESGGQINMRVVLSDLPKDSAMKLEIYLISLFKKIGIEITNTADGGLGFNHKGIPHSEEHKKNLSLAQPHKIRIPKDVLYDLYHNQKLSKRSIGKLYGCGPTSIDRRLVEYGISPRTTKNYKISYKLDKDEVIDLYVNQKVSILQIAKRYNIGVNGIRTLLFRENIEIDSNRRTPKEPDWSVIERLRELYESGINQKEIAKILNFCCGHISHLLKRHGIKKQKTHKLQ